MSDLDDNIYFSDSDDDLLGITDTPLNIKSSILHRNSYNSPSLYIPPNNSSYLSTRNIPSSEDGWIHCRRQRRNKNNPNKPISLINSAKLGSSLNLHRPLLSKEHLIPKELGRGLDICIDTQIKEDCPDTWQESQLTPTMEIIDMNNLNFEHQYGKGTGLFEIKQNKYQRMREIRGIIGFIVNVHDATNFDIDLEMSPELHEKYGDVISNQYTYQDLDRDFLENPGILTCKDAKNTEITPKIGTTYRCRLRGVGINQLATNVHTWKSNQMCVEVKQLIDRTDGWITCTLSDIDVYQRLLVDIVINTSKSPINLRDYLLSRMEHEDNPIFYPYSGKLNNGFKPLSRNDSFNKIDRLYSTDNSVSNRHDCRDRRGLVLKTTHQ